MTQATKTRLVSIFLAFVLGICAVITTAAQTPLVARAESTINRHRDFSFFLDSGAAFIVTPLL